MTDAQMEPVEQAGAADLFEIFYAPSAVFRRRQDGKFGLPYLVLAILGVVIFLATKNLMQPVIEAEITRGLAQAAAKNPQMTADQLASARKFGETIASAGIVIFFVVAPFIVAFLIWITAMIARISSAGKVAIMVATFSLYPRLVGSVVGAIEAAVMPESSITSAAALSIGPARFVDPVHAPALAAILGRFDLFAIWGIVLIAIGMQSAAKATKGQAWTTAIGVWVIASILPVLQGLRAG
ncbi:MAG: YIP1 family protein [Gemmatimonadales bacterium]